MTSPDLVLRPQQIDLIDRIDRAINSGCLRIMAQLPTGGGKTMVARELRAVGQERGYKSGWAAMKYKEKFGSFPPWSWNDLPVLDPSASTVSWVRSRQIAFAKAAKGASWR